MFGRVKKSLYTCINKQKTMKKQIFYSETLTRTKVVNNILKVFNASNDAKIDGLKWYNQAHNFCHEQSIKHIRRCMNRDTILNKWLELRNGNCYEWQPLTKYHVAGIVSALSPLQAWQRNKDLAVEFIEILEKGGDVYELPYMKGQIEKAVQIASVEGGDVDRTQGRICEILGGAKTISFFLNIANTWKSNEVTIDRHALSIALGKKLSNNGFKNHKMSKAQYNFFANCYRLAAQKKGINGLEMQAQTWEFWRVSGVEFQKQLNNLLKLKD